MASALSRSAGRIRLAVAAVPHPSYAGTSYSSTRSLSASVRRWEDEKPKHPSSSSDPSSSTSATSDQVGSSNHSDDSSGYRPPSKSSGAWPYDSTSSTESQSSQSTTDAPSTTTSDSNPYSGLFDGNDPFPTVTVPKLGNASTSSLDSLASSDKASWLSDQLDSLTTSPRTPRATARSSAPADERKKHSIPRSVLFADSENARRSDDFRPRKTSATNARKRFDRSPLTQQEANAFMSLLNSALAGTSSSSSSSTDSTAASPSAGEATEHTPFGSYTSLISDPKTQSGSRALLQAFAKRNRLKRFEDARAQRAKRFVREGLAAQIDPLQLEAGIDEAREQIAMCENLAELLTWTKQQVWGIGATTMTPSQPEQLADMLSSTSLDPSTPSTAEAAEGGPRYGKDTPYYASVLHFVFLAIRDRYRSPQTALCVPRTTRALGIESYVLGMTASLYNEVLKTQWDWLGDLSGVVSTLRQARETGILASTNAAGSTRLSSSEDDAIRETVDRIANDVRRYVLDQQISTDRAHQIDALSANTRAAGKKTEGVRGWSQNWLLANAEEATGLAGQPHRLTVEKRSRFDPSSAEERDARARSGGGGGGGRFSTERRLERRSPDSDRFSRGRETRSAARYDSSTSYNSRSTRAW
ncbi:hypothetical protein EX895_002500 [Sporisorium graminicola]|uniref:Mtf2-like C-terminal domain-containing protein n=1 Tax=Sporisorium graminicola TaxID=280036 RepID=A0A4U7L027_9BASI|nr:hypothetical protein EX895_002500 [Sporisorium graminicola]TKY88512.1 hypothetical protein EX895_002500 [Sporisorium graminicola]